MSTCSIGSSLPTLGCTVFLHKHRRMSIHIKKGGRLCKELDFEWKGTPVLQHFEGFKHAHRINCTFYTSSTFSTWRRANCQRTFTGLLVLLVTHFTRAERLLMTFVSVESGFCFHQEHPWTVCHSLELWFFWWLMWDMYDTECWIPITEKKNHAEFKGMGWIYDANSWRGIYICREMCLRAHVGFFFSLIDPLWVVNKM